MPRESIEELYRRHEFNKTEPETLRSLVTDAMEKGEGLQKSFSDLRNSAKRISEVLEQSHRIMIGQMPPSPKTTTNDCLVGVDGSNQLVGGLGGLWFAPLSVAMIVFPRGMEGNPDVHVTAHIEQIREQDYINVSSEVERRMLLGETKAIVEWAMQGRKSTLMIDGPIVDPPALAQKEYVSSRCAAIKECLTRHIGLMGIVKRIRDRFWIAHLAGPGGLAEEHRGPLNQFFSDLYLTSYVFATIRLGRPDLQNAPIWTELLDLSDKTTTHSLYREHGVSIRSFFFQKSIRHSILRIDLPVIAENSNATTVEGELVQRVVGPLYDWTLPDQRIPLPVLLADLKSNIRLGCAEVLYDEIMTRGHAGDPLDGVASSYLR